MSASDPCLFFRGHEGYEEVDLPGAAGLVDVMHVHWANYHTGNFNWSKGK